MWDLVDLHMTSKSIAWYSCTISGYTGETAGLHGCSTDLETMFLQKWLLAWALQSLQRRSYGSADTHPLLYHFGQLPRDALGRSP